MSDMLIRDNRLGKALAEALGTRSAVLMRGHGSTVVGTSIEQALYRAIYAEVNAKLQAAGGDAGRSELSQPEGGGHGRGHQRYAIGAGLGALAAGDRDHRIGRSVTSRGRST